MGRSDTIRMRHWQNGLERGLICLLTLAFVLTQCDFALANDAPALVLSNSGDRDPVISINSKLFEDSQAQKEVRDEEEKHNRELLEKNRLILRDENPLTLPDEDVIEEEKSGKPSEEKLSDEVDNNGKEKADGKSQKNHKEIENESPINKADSASSLLATFAEGLGHRASNVAPSSIAATPRIEATERAVFLAPPIFPSWRYFQPNDAPEEKKKPEPEKKKRDPRDKDNRSKPNGTDPDTPSSRPNAKPAVPDPSKIPDVYVPPPTPIPGPELTTPVSDPSINPAFASPESSAERADLLLPNPESYASPLSGMASGLIMIITNLVALTNDPNLISSSEATFTHSIELLQQEIADVLVQIVDLQNAVEKLAQEQKDFSDEFDVEVGLVNKFAKAIAAKSVVTKAGLDRIISNAKPVYIDHDYLVRAQSVLTYIETQLIKLEEIRIRRSQIIESMRKADMDPQELKDQLKETSKVLIKIETLKSLAQATKDQLIELFKDLEKSHERLRDAILKIRAYKETIRVDAIERVVGAKDYVYYVYASAMEVRERVSELNEFKEQVRTEAKNNKAVIIEFYNSLKEIDISLLESPTREEVGMLRSHAEKLLPNESEEAPATLTNPPENSDWEKILLGATNIELLVSAATSNGKDQHAIAELALQMRQVVFEAERLAGFEQTEADNAEIQARNAEAIAKGHEKRLDLVVGYFREIENLLAREGIILTPAN